MSMTYFFWASEVALSLALLAICHFRKVYPFFWLRSFLVLKCLCASVLYFLISYKPAWSTLTQRYHWYFTGYWTFYALDAFISFMVIRELFLSSLEPLEGLRSLGMILFGWIASLSAVVALAVSFVPSSHSGLMFLIQAVSEFQRCQSILQMCLLIFLFMVARPLGVQINNRIFGASMGFSLLAMSDLLLSGWFHTQRLESSVNALHASALSIALCVWLIYAFLPEPERVPVALPVTSALLRWNEVAKSLGKSGGRVVVVGNREIIDNDIAAWDKAVAVVRSKHPMDQVQSPLLKSS
jgi:hypothetical protein